MHTMRFSLALAMGALLASAAPAAETPLGGPAKAGKTVRLLTIGNSFSQNATRFLPQLAAAAGHKLIHRPIVVGGASLELHAEKARKHERDPNDKAGLYANGRSLREQLAAEPWDFVTIQQASLKSHDLASYRPFAGQLGDYVKRYAPGAKLLVHQTWAYRCDDPRFTRSKAGSPASREAMYQGLSAAYRTVAAELGAGRIPVGDAFQRADTDPQWGYRPDKRFDFANARPPTLPDQTHSLHVGWRWTKQKDGRTTLAMDGHHANVAGEYLGACVFFETLFDESVVGNAYSPPGLDAPYGRFLQETAHQAVLAMRPGEAK